MENEYINNPGELNETPAEIPATPAETPAASVENAFVLPTAPAEPYGTESAPVYSAPTPVKKKPWPTILAIVAAAAVVLTIIFSAVAHTPANLILRGMNNTMKAAGKSHMVDFLEDVTDNGSIEAVVTGDIEGVDLNVAATLFFGKEKAAVQMKGSVDSTEVVDATVYANKKEIVVASEALLGKDAYGVNLSKMEKNFDSSAFGEDGDYSLGVEWKDIEKIAEAAQSSKKLTKTAEKAVTDLVKTAVKTAVKCGETEKKNETLTFGDKKVRTTAVTITMDAEAVTKWAETMLEHVEKDKNIDKLIDEMAEFAVISTVANEYVDKDAEELKEEFKEQFKEAISEGKDSLEDLQDELESADVEIKMTFYIAKSGDQMVGVTVNVTADGEEAEIRVMAGPSAKELKEIRVEVEADSTTVFEAVYEVTEDSGKNFKAELDIESSGREIASGELEWNKKSGDLSITAEQGGEEIFEFEGKLIKKGNKTTLTVDLEEYIHQDIQVEVTLSKKAKMPSAPKYKDILTMSGDEIDSLVEDIEDAAEEIGDSLDF